MATLKYSVQNKNFYNIYQSGFKAFDCPILYSIETFLESEVVCEYLFNYIVGNNYKIGTKVAYLNALKQLFYQTNVTITNHNFLAKIDAFIKKGKKEIYSDETKNQLSGKEVQNWRPWTEIVEMYNRYNEIVDKQVKELKGVVYVGSHIYYLLQTRLLFACYIFQSPVRLDYGRMQIGEEINPTLNHVVYRDGEIYFNLVSDKVGNKIGTFEYKMDVQIKNLLQEIIDLTKKSERKYFLTHHCSITSPLTISNSINDKRQMCRMLEKIPDLQGNPSQLSIDIIRSSYITHFFAQNPTLEEKIKKAREMRTSVQMMEVSYNKVGHTNKRKIIVE